MKEVEIVFTDKTEAIYKDVISMLYLDSELKIVRFVFDGEIDSETGEFISFKSFVDVNLTTVKTLCVDEIQ
jgi:hypothetical protein